MYLDYKYTSDREVNQSKILITEFVISQDIWEKLKFKAMVMEFPEKDI